jgi:hypothetical protein
VERELLRAHKVRVELAVCAEEATEEELAPELALMEEPRVCAAAAAAAAGAVGAAAAAEAGGLRTLGWPAGAGHRQGCDNNACGGP